MNKLDYWNKSNRRCNKTSILLWGGGGEGGGRMSSSDMLISSERPFSWVVGNIDAWWVINCLQTPRMSTVSFRCLPRLRGNNEGVHRKGGWYLRLVNDFRKKTPITHYLYAMWIFTPPPTMFLTLILFMSAKIAKKKQELLNQRFILLHSINEAWDVGIWHFTVYKYDSTA